MNPWTRRDFLRSSSAAIAAGLTPAALSQPAPSDDPLATARQRLLPMLRDLVKRSRVELTGGLFAHMPGADGMYQGIWPDDYLYPLMADPSLADRDELQKLADFLTASVVDLGYVPDRVERDGLPVLSPGGLNAALSMRMPLHLPAAWVRLLDLFESHGVRWSRRADWARVIERSFRQAPFSCGLAYIDPQRPSVGFGFNDTIAITGLELMSSLVLMRGLERAAALFQKELFESTIEGWRAQARAVRENLGRLFDPKAGGFLGGTRDGRQFSVWGSALAFGIATDAQRDTVISTLRSKKDAIFLQGCTRHIAEPGGWSRTLAPVAPGAYQNGGFWATGTGYVLPAIASRDRAWAGALATELADNIERLRYAEWLDAKGAPQGAKDYLASVALPLIGLRAIAEGKSVLELF